MLLINENNTISRWAQQPVKFSYECINKWIIHNKEKIQSATKFKMIIIIIRRIRTRIWMPHCNGKALSISDLN